MDFKQKAAEILFSELKTQGVSLNELSLFLERPPKPEMGDWSLPCFRLAKTLKKNPNQIAGDLVTALNKKKLLEFEKIEAAGGYLNFFIAKKNLAESVLAEVLKQKKSFGKNDSQKNKKILIEFSAPNTNKPLHIGHVRNNSLGMSLTAVLRANGSKVIPANLLNDRGVHICKTMLAYQKWGENKTPKALGQKSDHFLGDLYVQFANEAKTNPELEKEVQEMLLQWEKGDKKVRELWKKMNAWAIEGMKQTYEAYGIEFEKWYLESEIYDKADALVELGLKKGVFEKRDDGSVFALLEEYGLPNKTVIRQDGTSIYVTQDLALTKQKYRDFHFDEALWVVASEQDLYFRQLFKIFELLQAPWSGKCRHVSYGLVQLPSGRMKSREGTVVDADDLLSEVKAVAKKEIEKRYDKLSEAEVEKRANSIALAAIKFFMLKVDAKKEFTFNPEESISFEGETGPYILYAYARSKSILRKAGKLKAKPDFGLLSTETEKRLVSLVGRFPLVVQQVGKSLSPHSLCQFLLELSGAFNSFYHELAVLDEKNPALSASRLALVESVGIALCNGLELLDIAVLEEM
ncbi:MAG: arginine--tRNA ligase [Candidatus Micrarchaeota archaeon]